jgi:UDP-2,3-diacylglucosamine pyrophosphatase LpxH
MSGTRDFTAKRLSEVFEKSDSPDLVMEIDDTSKLIFFSDCHRGDNGWADDFAHNSMLFFHALEYYFAHDYTYIEVGDGDELWENSSFEDIRREHDHVFWAMVKFHKAGRLRLLWGNHDIERQFPEVVQQHLGSYFDSRTRQTKELFGEIEVHEGLILRHKQTGQEIFVVHGHQGSRFNDTYWKLGKFGVMHFWRHLQYLGVKDPTKPSADVRQVFEVEDNITSWICSNHQPVICGHTHRPAYPRIGEAPYFNIGSSVHPRAITGVEIVDGQISLIKWWLKADENGVTIYTREILVGPQPLSDYMYGPWTGCPA